MCTSRLCSLLSLVAASTFASCGGNPPPANPKKSTAPIVSAQAVASASPEPPVVSDGLDPLRVVLDIDVDGHFWENAPASQQIVKDLSKTLQDIGFEPAHLADPEATLAALRTEKTPDEAAKKIGAAFVIKGKLASEVQTNKYIRAQGVLEIKHLRDETAALRPIKVSSSGTDEKAWLKLSFDIMYQFRTFILAPLAQHPALRAFRKTKGRNAQVDARAANLFDYVDRMEKYEATVKQAQFKTNTEMPAAENGPATATLHSALGPKDEILGSSLRGVLVHSPDMQYFYNPKGSESVDDVIVGWKLFWLNPSGDRNVAISGAASTTLATMRSSIALESGHVVSPSPADEFAFMVSDPNGPTRMIRIDTKKKTRGWAVDDIVIAPGGKAAATRFSNDERNFQDHVIVFSLEDGRVLYDLKPPNMTNNVFISCGWLGNHRLAVLEHQMVMDTRSPAEVDPDVPAQRLHIVTIDSNSPADRVVYNLKKLGNFDSLMTSPNGKRVLLQKQSGYVTMFDMESKKFYLINVSNDPVTSMISADGTMISVLKFNGLHVIEPDKKQMRLLTNGSWRKDSGRFSPDGTRLYFKASYGEDVGTLSYLASVAVKDAGPAKSIELKEIMAERDRKP